MTNCPPVYRNLQCESFGNKRKITSQMLRQMCKNDAYLYEQIMALWDATDPESRKRFYPPDFMNIAHSFGIESHILQNYELEDYNYWNEVYRFSRTTKWKYIFDFNGSNDRIEEYDANGNRLMDGNVQYVRIYADSYLDVENSYNEQMLEVVNEDGVTTLRPPISTFPYNHTIHYEEDYDTKTANTGSKYVTKQKEKLGKAKKDASYKGAFNNWHCNNHWYNGFNRTKNYNIKSKWRKDQDTYDIPSVCHAQTFKAENTGRLSKVNLNVQGTSSAVSPCIVEIRETSKKGYPTSKVLARTEKKFSGSGDNVVAFEFKNKALVTKGKTYAIVIRSPLSTFAKCYRIGGWTVGCFSSEKKYYGNGSAFTSEDNGKTWVKNGKTKDTKSYGSHYYDWGINQKPIDLAFEVFVQPITQKEIKEKVTTSNAKQLIEDGYVLQDNGDYKKILKDAYDEKHTYEISYISEGSYYLHLKPIHLNPIDLFTISNDFTDDLHPHSSQWWKWEYYDIENNVWVEVPDEGVDFKNSEVNYTVLKLRIRCDIEQNTYVGGLEGIEEGSNLYELVYTTGKLTTATLTYLKSSSLLVLTKLPTQAYLRTLYYHPPQNEILGANIWSEIGLNAQIKGDASVEIDVIHEKLATEHFKFYDLNILNSANMDALTVQQSELIYYMRMHINQFRFGEDTTHYIDYTASWILDYVVEDNGEFIEYLMNLLTPVYLLPLYYDGAMEPIYFFDKVQLSHLPSYPLNGCEIGDDDIVIDPTLFKGASSNGFYYSIGKNIKSTLSSIDVTYTTRINVTTDTVVDENGFEVNDADIEERIEETLRGIFLDTDDVFDSLGNVSYDFNDSSIDYALTKNGATLIFNAKSKFIQRLFPNSFTGETDSSGWYIPNPSPTTTYNSTNPFTTVLSSNTSVSNFELKINLTSKSYQEFVDFEVDYDKGTIDFHSQLHLIGGDFNIAYNPLWVRGLSIADFPLKMDLWKEKYRVGTYNGKGAIFKRKYDVNNGKYVDDDKFFGQTRINPYTGGVDAQGRSFYTFDTTVAPRDNIRKLVINEGTVDERVLVEDSQFFVDYLSNQVTFYISDLNENDIITIHYTPNLTDDGLALAYRLKRNRYSEINGEYVEQPDDDLTAQALDIHDVYIGMNYFTYRT